MKVLPLVLAMASLVASVTAAQDASRFPTVQMSHVGSTATTSGSGIDEQGRGLRFRADRADLTTAQGAGRRSIWQLLVGSESRKRRAVPSRVRRRRASAKKRQAGSCKAPTSTQTSSSSTASAPTPSSTGDADTKTATNKVMAGYWPDWVNSNFPPTQIDFTKFDMLNYAFALPTAQFDLSIPTDPSGGLLRSFVKACKAGNTKALLSIGGWGGSTYFSPAVRTSASRKTFITNILKMYNQYSLDGIDLDWEYPGQTGAGNQLDASDTANFQTFLTELRAALPQGALITGAVSHNPWMASNGQPVQSVARAAAAMDYVMIMNYDVWGSSSVPGPNAPLANLCGNSTQPGASAAAGVKQWSAAGMPRNKILLGIPSYGYINTSGKKTLRTRAVGLSSLDGSSGSGQINFNMLVQQGALKKGTDGLYDGAGGFTKYWDDCSDTPFLSDGTRVVSYDDTSSTFDKGAFASAAAIGGISMWSIDGDTKDWALVNSAIAGMSSTTASS